MRSLNIFPVCTAFCLKARGVALKNTRPLTLQSSDICRAFPCGFLVLSVLLLWSRNLLISLWLRIISAYCFMIAKFYLIITLPYQKQALVMQTTNLPVYNFSDCVKKRIKRDKLGREMMLLKYEVYPTWLSSLPCPPCAPLGTSSTGKGSFPKCGRNFGRWELGLEGWRVQVGPSRGMVVAGLQRPTQ